MTWLSLGVFVYMWVWLLCASLVGTNLKARRLTSFIEKWYELPSFTILLDYFSLSLYRFVIEMDSKIFGSYTKHEWKEGGKWGALVCSKSEKWCIPKFKREKKKSSSISTTTTTWVDRIRAALYNLDSTFAKLCIMFLLVIKYQHGDVSEPIKKHDVSEPIRCRHVWTDSGYHI